MLRPRRTQSLCLSVLTRDCKSRGRPSAHVDVRSRGHTEVRASRARVSRDSHVCEIPCDCHSCLWVRSLARQDDWAGKGRLGLHRAHRLRQKLFPAHYETRHRHTSTDRRVIVHVYVCVTHSSAKPVAPRRSQSASAESSTRPPHAARSASSLASNLLPEGEHDGESGGGLSSSGACGGRRTG